MDKDNPVEEVHERDNHHNHHTVGNHAVVIACYWLLVGASHSVFP